MFCHAILDHSANITTHVAELLATLKCYLTLQSDMLNKALLGKTRLFIS